MSLMNYAKVDSLNNHAYKFPRFYLWSLVVSVTLFVYNPCQDANCSSEQTCTSKKALTFGAWKHRMQILTYSCSFKKRMNRIDIV